MRFSALSWHRYFIFHHFRCFPFSQSFIVSTAGVGSAIGGNAIGFFIVNNVRLFEVNLCDVRTCGGVAQGAVSFTVVRYSSVYVMVILRVLPIRFWCFFIQARGVNSFARSLSVDNDCKFSPFYNFPFLGVKRLCTLYLVDCDRSGMLFWGGGGWLGGVTTVVPRGSTVGPRMATFLIFMVPALPG